VGAGTSGRLGVIEAAECPPTFDTPPGQVRAVIAGGRGAVFRSVEGAEDDAAEGARAIRRRARAGDLVVGIAASGVTPFVRGALDEARRRRAATVLVTCNPAVSRRAARVVVALDVGPEVLAGSTRLKAGTATKLALNTLTTGAFARLGKVHGNRMVDVRPRSAKLRARAIRVVAEVGGVGPRAAARLLQAARDKPKVAIAMARLAIGAAAARQRLRAAAGSLRRALEPRPRRARRPMLSSGPDADARRRAGAGGPRGSPRGGGSGPAARAPSPADRSRRTAARHRRRNEAWTSTSRPSSRGFAAR
jgi:N-acetylmuramic acid 6-phosphate etherase